MPLLVQCVLMDDRVVMILPRRDEVIHRETEKNEEIKTLESVTGSTLRTNSSGL